MDKRQLLIGVLTASLFVGAVPGLTFAQDETAVSPEGVEWTLATLAGEAVPEGVATTLLLSGGEAVGNAGCNSYFGRYELEGESLTFPNPFGATQKLCESPAQDVEDAYLSLLQATASWSIDDEGALSLADAEGMVQLVYGEAPVAITATEVDTLVATLGDLQDQIDRASAEVAALAAETAAIPVNRFDRRVTAVEKDVERLDDRTEGLNVEGLRRRITALEETTTRLDRTIDRFRDRIIALEQTSQNQARRLSALEASKKDHEKRIKALEDAAPTPEQPLP